MNKGALRFTQGSLRRVDVAEERRTVAGRHVNMAPEFMPQLEAHTHAGKAGAPTSEGEDSRRLESPSPADTEIFPPPCICRSPLGRRTLTDVTPGASISSSN